MARPGPPHPGPGIAGVGHGDPPVPIKHPIPRGKRLSEGIEPTAQKGRKSESIRMPGQTELNTHRTGHERPGARLIFLNGAQSLSKVWDP